MNGYLQSSLSGQKEKEYRLQTEIEAIREKVEKARNSLTFLAYKYSQELAQLETTKNEQDERVIQLKSENLSLR